jgi:hypothetical protein
MCACACVCVCGGGGGGAFICFKIFSKLCTRQMNWYCPPSCFGPCSTGSNRTSETAERGVPRYLRVLSVGVPRVLKSTQSMCDGFRNDSSTCGRKSAAGQTRQSTVREECRSDVQLDVEDHHAVFVRADLRLIEPSFHASAAESSRATSAALHCTALRGSVASRSGHRRAYVVSPQCTRQHTVTDAGAAGGALRLTADRIEFRAFPLRCK